MMARDKVWITVDGQRVFSCKHYSYKWAEAEAYHDGSRGGQVKELLRKNEIHRPKDFGDAMRDYLDMSISEALKSSDPLVKAFALVDRRLGRRTLAKLDITDSDHTLVKAFYALRLAIADNNSQRFGRGDGSTNDERPGARVKTRV
jgi:hypothetical protein